MRSPNNKTTARNYDLNRSIDIANGLPVEGERCDDQSRGNAALVVRAVSHGIRVGNYALCRCGVAFNPRVSPNCPLCFKPYAGH